MKKFIGLMVGLMLLAGVAMAYSTKTYWATGTTTSGAIITITHPAVVNSITLINDGTDEVYFNPRGDLSTMTVEALVVASGEVVTFSDFRTKKSKIQAKADNSVYRIWSTY